MMMHYQRNAFSNSDQDTIVPKKPGTKIHPRDDLIKQDVVKIVNLYGDNYIIAVILMLYL